MIFNKTIQTILFHAIFFFFCPNSIFSQVMTTSVPPKHEVRAVWLTTIGGLDWPHSYAQSSASIAKQKAELTATLDRLQHAGINTILFQTRIRGTVIYPSSIEPWDGCCSGMPGRSPGYDPLEFAITESHRRGMELQAWIVSIPIGNWNGLGCRTLRRKYPKMVVRKDNEGFIDPSSPTAAPYIASICREITARYDIDGIHLDYIRYPETWNVKSSMKDAARRNITAIVREVSSTVRNLKPWVKISCSPIGKYSDLSRYSSKGWNAYDKGCQDAQSWLRTGLMDQLYPMMYFRGNQFYPFVMDWIENSGGRTVVPGLGLYFLSPNEGNWPTDEIERQLSVLRSLGTGFAFFRTKFLLDDVKGLCRFTTDQINRWPALVPPMTWARRTAPSAPMNLKTTCANGLTTLTWNAPQTIPQGGVLYNVYASSTFPVNTADPQNLIAVRFTRNSLAFRAAESTNFAVTAIDRWGLESRPIMTPEPLQPHPSTTLIQNNGRIMTMPLAASETDADYIIICNIAGQALRTIPCHGRKVDITSLPNGFYSVKTLDRKGQTHRLGFLLVRR